MSSSPVPDERTVSFSSYLSPEAVLAKGRFLVASRQLNDPRFAQTVVLLLHYEKQGAMGVVINQPTDVKLAEVLPEIEALRLRTDTVYIGGPVSRNQILLLIRSNRQSEEARHVFGDIYVSANRNELRRLAEEEGNRFRVYAGHAGWAPDQLDGEVTRGDWYVVPGDATMVFDKAPEEIWPELIRRGTARWLKYRGPSRHGSFWALN
jgi:putative transcriptional regulator